MTKFRTINYGKMLYEALRNYFSVNTQGNLSILYRFMAAVIQPLQGPFNNYVQQRQILWLIANCKWQIGQLTNVLNYLYDPMAKRIFITQSKTTNISATTFEYPATLQARKFGEATPAQGRKFLDSASTTVVTINVPSSVSVPAITATIELIRLQGIPYSINVIP